MFLKECLSSCLAIAALSAVSWSAQVYRIEPGWSHVEFAVKNFGIHTVEGRFKSFSGTVALDETDVTKSSVTVTLQAASIDTDSKKRDEHLRTADFFDVNKTPEITFHSESIVKKGAGYIMTGPLTIKGHTQQVELPFAFNLEKSQDGKSILHAQANGSIDRHAFGIDYGSNFSVGKEVKMIIHIQAVP